MHYFNASEVGVCRESVSLVLEEHGNGAHKDGEHLAGGGKGHGNGDACVDVLVACNDHHGCDGGCQCGVGCHGGTDVHPAEGDEFECAAKDDTRG